MPPFGRPAAIRSSSSGLAIWAPALLVTLSLAACSGTDGSDGGLDGSPMGDSGRDAAPADPCLPNPCDEANRSVCTSSDDLVACACDPGFELNAGECLGATACEDDTCGGRGDCTDTDAGPECACGLGYDGRFCAMCDTAAGYYDDGDGGCTLDACTPNPCDDPARRLCSVVDMVATCLCNAGSHDEGGTCVPDTVCSDTTCAGHGTCAMADGMTECTCDDGWDGAGCDGCDVGGGYHEDGAGGCTTDACLPNPCTEPLQSICVDEGGITSCACDPGAHLDGAACVPDEFCEAATCGTHGACSVVMGLTRCACDLGWDGPACGACASGYHDDGAGGCTTDVCLPNPCTAPDQSVCVAMGTTPTCECDPGAHPDGVGGCTTDPCTPDPCMAINQACRVVGGASECFTPVCDDSNPCTDDSVVGGACRNVARPDGSACDTDLCTELQTCTASVCGGGAARSCDDGNPCTRDSCAAGAGCSSVNDDGLTPPDDGVPCTVGTCSAGASSHVPTDSRCDDGLWCTGTETCAPGAGADASGCVVGGIPTPPGPSTPCRPYVCDEATDSFYRMPLGVGDACDDGIACTTGDACDAAGTCAGSITAACAPGTGGCTGTTPYETSIDIGVAPVTGTITQNGGPLPMSTPRYENGVIWARSQDTGGLHRLRLIDWTSNGSSPNYTRSAGTDQLETTLIPGIYDILYERAWQSSAEYVSEQKLSPYSDPVVNGYRVIRPSVIVPAGGIVLDVDIGATAVTGTITLNGAALPMSTPRYENGVIWARSQDTGRRHRLRVINWTSNGSYPNYTRSAGTDLLETTLVPGTYDILYQRAWQSSSEYVSEQQLSPYSDPVVTGFRTLQTGVAVSGASQVINVDIGATTITGTITQNGAALPMSTPRYENGVIWARSQDTGRRHRLRLINWTSYGSSPNYTRGAGTDLLETTLVPGTYDILYQRAWQSSSEYVSEQQLSPYSDPVVNGYRTLQTGVAVSGASQVINVDIGATTITGTITQNGAALPMSTPRYENGVIWARSQDTGRLHRLRLINWTSNGSYPNYTRSVGTGLLETTLVPGTYDILYQRARQSSSEYVTEQKLVPYSDPVVNGFRALQTGVVVSGASQVINVDIGSTAITGTITQNGAALPMSTPRYENGVIWAKSQDTGTLHRLRLINWTSYGSSPNYTRGAGTDLLETTLVPGTYDILYQRAWQSSSEYVSEQQLAPYSDPVVNGYRTLQTGVAVSGASQVINVDIGATAVTGTISMAGVALPMSTPRYENGVLWARSRDTGRRHRLRVINWTSNGSHPNYTRSVGSELIETTLVPGTYDILYQRAWQSSSEYVSEQQLWPYSDPVVNGFRVLRACVLVP